MPAKIRIAGRNKFGAKKITIASVTYDSQAEAEYALELEQMRKRGLIEKYWRQVKYNLVVNGKHICDHIIDFVILRPDGVIEAREVKGMETDVWKLKRKLFEALFPGTPYIVIKRGVPRPSA